MKNLTAEELQKVLNYDPLTGIFVWQVGPRKGAKAGTKGVKGYVQIVFQRERYYAHRLAWLYMTGEWPKQHIDHLDGDPSNNRFQNLIYCRSNILYSYDAF